MKRGLIALLVALGLATAWTSIAWSDPIEGPGARRYGDRDAARRIYDRPRRERIRERRISRYEYDRRYERRRYDRRYERRFEGRFAGYDERPRYRRSRYYEPGPYSRPRRYYEGPRYGRGPAPIYPGPRYTPVAAPPFSPAPFYNAPPRIPIYPYGALPGAYGWRDNYDPVGPFANPANVEEFFSRSQSRN